MNKFNLLPLALCAALFSACTSDDVADKGNGEGTDESYLAINLQNVGEAPGTRAEYQKDGTYEDGTEAESKISDVRFYFFNSDGSPYMLEGQNKNWLTPTDDINNNNFNQNQTVEKISNTVLLIKGTERTAPHSVVAVVNSSTLANNLDNTLGDGPQSLSAIREIQDTKFYEAQGNAANKFVMTNSVYLSAGTEVCATQVSGHVAANEVAAQNNPIDIYVERVAAKVNASIDNTDTNANHDKWQKGTSSTWGEDKWAYKLDEKFNNKDVYAVVEGWGVADENGRATLEKTISTSWTSNELGINPWSTSDYHRSFWGNSVNFVTGMGGNNANQPVNHNYNAISTTLGTPVYTLANTPKTVGDFAEPMENTLTKFIVAAKLMYQDDQGQWKDAEICQYKGIRYLGAESVLSVVANENSTKYFKKTTGSDDSDQWESLEPTDYKFSTSAPVGSSISLKDYEVIPQLADGVTEVYDADHNMVAVGTVNQSLATTTNLAQIRTEGRTYYYTPIRHLATNDNQLGYYGVVRNHSYKINLQSITGFGTPVFDPTKVIDPTLPTDEKTWLAARINVLSWRVVKSDVNLDSNR